MRIISKFTDYYDSVQALGMDKNCLYFRKESLVGIKVSERFEQLRKEVLKKDKWHTCYAKEFKENKKIVEFNKILIGFCGTLHLLYKFEHIQNWESKEVQLFYTEKEAQAYFEKIKKDYPFYSHYAYLSLRNLGTTKLNLKRDEEYKKLLNQDFADCFHALHTPVFIYPARVFDNKKYLKFWKQDGYREKYGESSFWINPSLKNIHFFQVKDPYSCYQEIFQFLSGVLGTDEQIEIKMSELDKVTQHGFDSVYGFRTRPGSKTKRKKKKKR